MLNKRFKNLEQLEGVDDGFVMFEGIKVYNEEFDNQDELCEFIVYNIDKFTKDHFNDEVVSYEVEKPLRKQFGLSPRGKRVDLFIQGKEKKYVIEFKNTKQGSTMRYSIGQILDYGREFFDSYKKEDVELVLVSTCFDIHTAKTIEYFDLPIRYLYIDKERFLEFYETNERE